jgi:hypothetical protein
MVFGLVNASKKSDSTMQFKFHVYMTSQSRSSLRNRHFQIQSVCTFASLAKMAENIGSKAELDISMVRKVDFLCRRMVDEAGTVFYLRLGTANS